VPRVAAVLALVAVVAAPAAALDGRRLRALDGRLVDQHGREVILRGVNARAQGVFDVTFDDGRLPLEPIPVFDDGDAARMQGFGFNLLRLPISWSALEPLPGIYDKAYLARVAAIVAACGRHGVVVLLDLHQDAFSKEIGEDGAPRWVLDLLLGADGYPYIGGPLGDLFARRIAPATILAFRGLFADQSGVQGLLGRAAAVVAKRFRGSRAVVGYETLNEPFAVYAGVPNSDVAVRDLNVRVAQAIRSVDPRHLIAFEPEVRRNQFNSVPVSTEAFPVAGGWYAPHIYTDVFDGHDYASGNPADLAPSMEAAATEAAGWGAPLIVGEWGIDPNATNANAWITAELDLQDRLRASSAFWVWEETSQGSWGLFDGENTDAGGERVARTTALSRVYAQAVPGRVLEHTFDAAARTLVLRWQARGRAPLEVFVPARAFPTGVRVRCDGAAVAGATIPASGVLALRCGRRAGEHRLDLAPAS
jgi:endoglycosylceramidase